MPAHFNASIFELWLLLFAFSFGAIWITPIVARMLIQLASIRRWKSAEATVEQVESRNVLAVGDPSAAWPDKADNIFARYTYQVAGIPYTGTRLTILDSSLPLATNYDKNLLRTLNDAVSHNERITIWVDPEDPHNSIVTRKPYLIRLVVYVSIAAVSWGVVYALLHRFNYWQIGLALAFAVAFGKLLTFINSRKHPLR